MGDLTITKLRFIRMGLIGTSAVFFTACFKLDDPGLYPEFSESAVTEPAPLQASSFNPERNLYFGDLHIHTGFSTDAYVMGVRSVPEDVYRFAKGYTIEHAVGYPIKIKRPLDFVAVTDHSEYLGHARQANAGYPLEKKSLRDYLVEGSLLKTTLAWIRTTGTIRNAGFAAGIDQLDERVSRAAWAETIAAAQRHNDPNRFTAFIGYEWSASIGDIATHIHRNVIYESDDGPELPFSSLDSARPEDLWVFLEREEVAGRTAIAIPHNANVSKGHMYTAFDYEGKPIDADYAAMRSRFEPSSEILQIKGASETHPLLSNLDEFADYGIAVMVPGQSVPIEDVRGAYARDALRLGIELAHKEGFNPYDFGVIGASDSHNASSPSEESDYTGKLPMMDGSPGLRTSEGLLLPAKANPVTTWNSGGLAGVWAKENTRSGLFHAIRSKETYATSGPRMSLRMFGGWGLNTEMLGSSTMIVRAYENGVPMGGVLLGEGAKTSPGFLITASKDPIGANLDRLQVVKGWVDADGKSHEKVFNVAASGRRKIDPSGGRIAPVGSTVDLKTPSYTNSIGAASLSAFWQDPEFDPHQHAFYYARVLEIPTPRWSTYDAAVLGSEPIQPATIQERAVGSAIWYKPPPK